MTSRRAGLRVFAVVFALVASVAMSGARARARPPSAAAPRALNDLTFARVGQKPLQLDLYLPANAERRPLGLVVWVHGGAWRAGSRKSVDLVGLTGHGWAVASVDYRLSTQARFPAQVHDIKAAIRYLRHEAGTHGYPPDRFVIAGASAGGHLAALVGVSNGDPRLEGTVGELTGVSSDVQAIVDLYGASNLTTILQQSTPHGSSVRVPALKLLLGAPVEQATELARLASPVFHVDATAPPLLLLHGDQDAQMPINQAHELQGAYERHRRPVRFEVLHGSGHGGAEFTSPERVAAVASFLTRHLLRRTPSSR